MAERVIHKLVDDISGADISEGGGESIEFSVRGVSYRIDLSTANAAKFDRARQAPCAGPTSISVVAVDDEGRGREFLGAGILAVGNNPPPRADEVPRRHPPVGGAFSCHGRGQMVLASRGTHLGFAETSRLV